MSRVFRLLAYLAGTLTLGALLAYPAYEALRELADVEFDSVLRRSVVLVALVLLPLYLAGSGARNRSALGFACSLPSCLRGFLGGFGLGVLAVTPLLAAFVLLDIRDFTASAVGTPPELLSGVSVALIAAVIIGVVEEAYFRGALLAPLWPLSARIAVPLVSFVYAAAHFVGGPLRTDQVAWLSGLSSIARSDLRLDALLALFVAGLLLGAMRWRSGHVALGAGFHAGWVWLMKLNQEYGDVNPSSELLFLAGSLGGTMGYLGLAWLGLLGAMWLVAVRPDRS